MSKERASIFAGMTTLSTFPASRRSPGPSRAKFPPSSSARSPRRPAFRAARRSQCDVRRASIAPAARCSLTPAQRRKPSMRSTRSPISKAGLSARRSSTLCPRCNGSWQGRAKALGLEERCAVRVGKMTHAHFRRRSCRRCLVLFRLFCGAKAGKSSTKGSPKSSEVGTEPNNLSHHARCYSDVILALAKAELARREAH